VVYRDLAAEIIARPSEAYELMVHPGEDERGRREADELRRWLQYLPEQATRTI
jgi:hypothetical protein